MNLALFWALALQTASDTPQPWFPGTSSITEAEVIPPAYRGIWAISAAVCADPDAIEIVSIQANGADFYESGARLERVTQAGQERSIRLRLSYEGEGEFWERVETWTLNPSGTRLTMRDEPDGEPLVWVRC